MLIRLRYAEFYKKCIEDNQGGRVARIWIHKGLHHISYGFVTTLNLPFYRSRWRQSIHGEILNAPERFEKAFKDVPRNIWRLFENATELQSELESLKEDVNADTNADK